MKKLSLEQKLGLIDANLIGIWRFRQVKRKPLWCATIVHNGFYYDVEGYENIEDTLDAAAKKIKVLNSRLLRINGAKKNGRRYVIS